ncbi:hypothetical protein IMSHALPRED_008314 [Imshaugia aleurites]|uniref:Uncharacterized protein n=1 Tax=Imshaugia aleurites TaxID=172621 RepID=A0A8H3FXK8_9LECA|nr:hypothetical protein IMSHALPRED_008314 [Imshaugia aleurites]
MLYTKPILKHHNSPIAPRVVSKIPTPHPEPSRLRVPENYVPQSQPGEFDPGDLVIIAKEYDDYKISRRSHDTPIYRIIRTYRGSVSFVLYYELEVVQTKRVLAGVYEKEKLRLFRGQRSGAVGGKDWDAETLIGLGGDYDGIAFRDDETLRGD